MSHAACGMQIGHRISKPPNWGYFFKDLGAGFSVGRLTVRGLAHGQKDVFEFSHS